MTPQPPTQPQQQPAGQQPQQPPPPPVTVNYHQRRQFKEGSLLQQYLVKKKPESNLGSRNTTTLHEVLQLLKDIISDDQLYDDRNASIVLCDKALEDALDVKALHLTEIREQVLKQLTPVLPAAPAADGEGAQVAGGGGGGTEAPRAAGSENGERALGGGGGGGGGSAQGPAALLGGQSSAAAVAATVAAAPKASSPARTGASAQDIAALKATLSQVAVRSSNSAHGSTSMMLAPSPDRVPRAPTRPSSQQQQATPTQQPPTQQPAPVITGVTPQSEFTVKPDFRKVLALVPGVPNSQEVFTYDELTKHLSHYILSRKDKFFDDRNIKVALCDGDQLGDAFGVRAFHRTQVTSLLRTQLIPYVRPKNDNSNRSSGGGRDPAPQMTPAQRQAQLQDARQKEQLQRAIAAAKAAIAAQRTAQQKAVETQRQAQQRLASGSASATVTAQRREASAVAAARVTTLQRNTMDLYAATEKMFAAQNKANSLGETGGNGGSGQQQVIQNFRISVQATSSSSSSPSSQQQIQVRLQPVSVIPGGGGEALSAAAGASCSSTSSSAMAMASASSFGGSARAAAAAFAKAAQESRVRKRSPSDDRANQGAQRSKNRSASPSPARQGTSWGGAGPSSSVFQAAKRQRRRSSLGESDERAYSSDDQETIYSEQGYETVAVRSVFDEDSDRPEDEDEEEEVVEITSEEEEVADAVEEVFTEYEVDSDADREAERNLDDNDGNSSAEDSDVQDVVIPESTVRLTEKKYSRSRQQDEEGFADTDSDDSDAAADVGVLTNFDPEVGGSGSESWKCINCGVRNVPYCRYCSKCWQERKCWLPDRPKPRKRRKNKRTDGQPVKKSYVGEVGEASTSGSRPSFDRSVSMPGPSSQPVPSTSAAAASVSGPTSGLQKMTSVSDDDKEKEERKMELAAAETASVLSVASVASSATTAITSSSGDSGFSQSLSQSSQETVGAASTTEDAASSQDLLGGDEDDEIKKKQDNTCGYSSSTSTSTSLSAVTATPAPSSSRMTTVATSRPDLLCDLCLSRPKNAGINHGRITHQMCCYPCAKRLYKKRQPCPMCRRRIDSITTIISS